MTHKQIKEANGNSIKMFLKLCDKFLNGLADRRRGYRASKVNSSKTTGSNLLMLLERMANSG